MTDRQRWTPPPELLNETRAIVGQLVRRWPNRLGYLLERTDAAREDLTNFAYALRDIDARVLPLVAREYLLGNEFPPGPHELRVEALRLEARAYPKAAPDPLPPPPVDTGKDHARIAEVGHVLRAELGSLPLVMLAWEHLGKAAQASQEAAHAFRTGQVTPEAVAAAIVAVRAQIAASQATEDHAA